MMRLGQALISRDLAREYGFTDLSGPPDRGATSARIWSQLDSWYPDEYQPADENAAWAALRQDGRGQRLQLGGDNRLELAAIALSDRPGDGWGARPRPRLHRRQLSAGLRDGRFDHPRPERPKGGARVG